MSRGIAGVVAAVGVADGHLARDIGKMPQAVPGA